MAQALGAERSAEKAVREAQEAGALAVQSATERSARIARRCDERLRRMHDHCAAALAHRVRELVIESDTVGPPATGLDTTVLDSLLDRVAAWLTSPR
jgi:hypothetical protein